MSNAALKIVEGGKCTKGRPKKEEIESLRKETVDKLQALGVLDEVQTYAGKKGWGGPDRWNTSHCLKLLKRGRDLAGVPLCECGKPARHFGDKDDPCALCDDCHAKDGALGNAPEVDPTEREYRALLAGATFEGEATLPAVSLYFRDQFILARESWVFPYHSEVVLWEACLAARAEADRYRGLLALEQESMDGVLGPLKAITSDPEYRATMNDIIFMVTLDHGRPIRDFHDKAKTLMVDAFNRDEPKYKGTVKLIFKTAYDAKPSDNEGAAYTVEVKEETPPFVSGGRLYHDKKGNLLKAGEVYQALPLGQAGNDSQ